MSGRRVSMLAAIALCCAGIAMGQTVWVDNPANPVIGHDEVGPWAPNGAWPTAVVFDGTTYHMWFSGVEGGGLIGLAGIGHATSSDGETWTMDPANPVMGVGEEGEWDDFAVIGGDVVHDGSLFHMWYLGRSVDLPERIGYATSPDGTVWTRYDGNPVIEAGAPGSWDDTFLLPYAVISDDGTYKMWYAGAREDYVGRIGYAESIDGIEWTKRPEPVLVPGDYPGAWDGAIGACAVVYDGSTYHMWYETTQVGYAYSHDGVHWAKHRGNPVLEQTGEVINQGRVLRDGSVFQMWYSVWDGTANRISHATSTGGPVVPGLTHMQTIPAAAVASGAQGAFFQTDLDLNNASGQPVEYQLLWFPRGEDSSEPTMSEIFRLGAGMSVRYANVLSEAFDLAPNSVGALAVLSASPDLLAMSRTYNTPDGGSAGTYGQSIPAVAPGEFMIPGERRRILFASETADLRTNIGCVSASDGTTVVNLELFDAEGTSLERTMMILRGWGNDQLNRVFEDYRPVDGYVDVWTDVPNRRIYCYGSVLDNTTSDPTTILPQ